MTKTRKISATFSNGVTITRKTTKPELSHAWYVEGEHYWENANAWKPWTLTGFSGSLEKARTASRVTTSRTTRVNRVEIVECEVT